MKEGYGPQSPGWPGPVPGPSSGGPTQTSIRPHERSRRTASPFSTTLPSDQKSIEDLQRIDYVFVFPESKDLVIAGPAEGFAADSTGRVVGVTTGRPPLRLDDLMVALRALERAGTAAGDAFTACLLVSLPEGRERDEALARACAAGAITASRLGAQPSLPTAAEVDAILRS